MQNFILVCCFAVLVLFPVYIWAKPKPVDLMLAKVADIKNLFAQHQGYWLSEKYDGIRAYWNGTTLLTRRGNQIHCPQWFIENLPKTALDGELWISRGQFEQVSSTVRKKHADESEWQHVRFMVFDVPESHLPFEFRQNQLAHLLADINLPWVRQVKQLKVETETEVQTIFKQIVAGGGEGVMLNVANSYYYHGRTDRLLKLKPYLDEEATVLKHVEGKGKYAGMLGAIVVKNKTGHVFKIGSGFSDKERAEPPEIGTQVTYRYSGYTNSGKPRFATFVRKFTF